MITVNCSCIQNSILPTQDFQCNFAAVCLIFPTNVVTYVMEKPHHSQMQLQFKFTVSSLSSQSLSSYNFMTYVTHYVKGRFQLFSSPTVIYCFVHCCCNYRVIETLQNRRLYERGIYSSNYVACSVALIPLEVSTLRRRGLLKK